MSAPMRRSRVSLWLICLLVILLSTAAPILAQNAPPSGTISTAGADCSTATNCVGADVRNVPSFVLYLNVGTSGTFNFEGSVDATSNTTGTWFAIAEDVGAATSATADGALYFTNPGYLRFRLRASAISGDATITSARGTLGLRSAATISGGATAANQTTMITSLQLIDNIVSGTGANISQINGVAPLMGNGITGTGSPRVTIASDNTAFTVNAAQSGTWTVTANAGTGTFVVGDGAGALNVIVDSSALPTGAAAEATLAGVLTSTNFAAAFGTAGAADTQVASIQGIAGMTPVQVQSNSANLSTETTLASALTALQLIDNVVSGAGINVTQWVGAAPSATNPVPVRIADGAVFPALLSATNTNEFYISVGTTEDENEIDANTGTLVGLVARNGHASANAFMRCSNATAANTTPGTTGVIYEIMLPFGLTVRDDNIGLAYSTALTCWVVTGKATTDVTEVVANDVSYVIRTQ